MKIKIVRKALIQGTTQQPAKCVYIPPEKL